MIDFLQQYNPVTQALIATLFTWGVTAAGASLVFFTKTVKPKLMDSMLGFAALEKRRNGPSEEFLYRAGVRSG